MHRIIIHSLCCCCCCFLLERSRWNALVWSTAAREFIHKWRKQLFSSPFLPVCCCINCEYFVVVAVVWIKHENESWTWLWLHFSYCYIRVDIFTSIILCNFHQTILKVLHIRAHRHLHLSHVLAKSLIVKPICIDECLHSLHKQQIEKCWNATA